MTTVKRINWPQAAVLGASIVCGTVLVALGHDAGLLLIGVGVPTGSGIAGRRG